MKPALLLTLCLATTVVQAEEPASATPPPAARRFVIAPADSAVSPAQQEVTAKLPKYDPNAPKEVKSTGTVGTPSPDAIELPKMTIRRPRERPRLAPVDVLTNKALEEKAGALDSKLLNKFTLPGWMGGQTAAERAREEQRLAEKQEFTQDVNTIAKVVGVTDPAQAKALRDAVAKP
ncbi:MAG: hypothetical protein PSW75_04215 [bacterium]|nr:hypothetical protein [bacterium]MDI1336922.1 hypothetical protein [Lacunisphaera sp.]